MSCRILMTARDAAAALHLIEVARACAGRADIVLEIATQDPATRYFRAAGIETRHLDLPAAKSRESAEGDALIAAAEDLIASTRPDALLCGLSTPFDAGIDEAAIVAYGGPSFVMQDFWGEANLVLGKPADLYLALDEEGARLSAERHGLEAVVVGSPRHSAYGAMNIEVIRGAERERLGIRPDATVFGFFGQALHSLAGYRRTLAIWTNAVMAQSAPCAMLYRPHPRESVEDVRWTYDSLLAANSDCILGDAAEVEHALLACDVVCSAFSNCSYDVAYLNYFSNKPLITPVSLFFDPEIVAYFRNMVRLDEFPYLKLGLVKAVRDSDDLTDALSRASTLGEKTDIWTNARTLTNPAHAPRRVLDRICG